jgi:hypothetical protein
VNWGSVASSGVFPSGPFLRYWRAQAVSGLGSYVTLFALQVLVVLTLHGSAADVGWLNAARWLPYPVFGLVVGAVVDGRRRLPLMVGADLLLAGLLMARIPGAPASGSFCSPSAWVSRSGPE